MPLRVEKCVVNRRDVSEERSISAFRVMKSVAIFLDYSILKMEDRRWLYWSIWHKASEDLRLRSFGLRDVFHKLECMRHTVQTMYCTRGYQRVVFKGWLSVRRLCEFLQQREQGNKRTSHVIFSAFASPLLPWKHNNTIPLCCCWDKSTCQQ